MFRYTDLNHRLDAMAGKFFIVTQPSSTCTMDDICFETTISGLANQLRGGLNEATIALITKDKTKADELARELLDAAIRIRESA